MGKMLVEDGFKQIETVPCLNSRVKPNYMPLSFFGFGSVAILAMVLILTAAEGVNYLKEDFIESEISFPSKNNSAAIPSAQ